MGLELPCLVPCPLEQGTLRKTFGYTTLSIPGVPKWEENSSLMLHPRSRARDSTLMDEYLLYYFIPASAQSIDVDDSASCLPVFPPPVLNRKVDVNDVYSVSPTLAESESVMIRTSSSYVCLSVFLEIGKEKMRKNVSRVERPDGMTLGK